FARPIRALDGAAVDANLFCAFGIDAEARLGLAADLALRLRRLDHVFGVFILLLDRKSTRLNSSHVAISYAVFCLKKKNKRCIQLDASNWPCTTSTFGALLRFRGSTRLGNPHPVHDLAWQGMRV